MNRRLAGVVVVLCCLRLQAATFDAIRGAVTDARSGLAIQNAQIIVVGDSHHTESNSRGSFELWGLLPGAYTLQISAHGYRAAEIHVFPSASAKQIFSVSLIPSQFAQIDKVSVEASASQLPGMGDHRELTL